MYTHSAGHSVSYSCVCNVDREWVNGGFLSILSEFSYLASVLCTCFSCKEHKEYTYSGIVRVVYIHVYLYVYIYIHISPSIRTHQ